MPEAQIGEYVLVHVGVFERLREMRELLDPATPCAAEDRQLIGYGRSSPAKNEGCSHARDVNRHDCLLSLVWSSTAEWMQPSNSVSLNGLVR